MAANKQQAEESKRLNTLSNNLKTRVLKEAKKLNH